MNPQDTGKFIAELRKEHNLTQAQLAERLHVSDKAVSRWETGKGYPDINSLQDISDALGVTVVELLKGRRIDNVLPKEEVQEITVEGIGLIQSILKKNRIPNLLGGFLAGLLLITLIFIHLTSPIYIQDAKNAVTIDTLSDGSIVAILNEDVAGYEFDYVSSGGYDYTALGCYTTRWHQISGNHSEIIAVIGNRESSGDIYYYPGVSDDQLLYESELVGQNKRPSGIATLPRLVYNYWIIMGWGLTAVGFFVYLSCRKKDSGNTMLKIMLVPLALTLSTHLCLFGKQGEVFNAAFYFSGIGLVAIVIYALLILLLRSLNVSR